ncbi:hypothetical protein EDB19DRAFT_1305835 [Suillus lakei]|nr:hypothetical protein EDB19DRAFT_1305835 [Suillus lakei]
MEKCWSLVATTKTRTHGTFTPSSKWLALKTSCLSLMIGATRPPPTQQLPPSFLDDAQSNTDGATNLQQLSRRSIVSRDPRIVEVAATPDNGPLSTAPPPAQQPRWTRVMGFLCCAPSQHADGDAAPTQQQEGQSQGQVQTHSTSSQTQQQQPGQSQGQVQAQASSPQTQPTAPLTSATPTSSSRPDGLIIRLFSLFRSQPHTNEDIKVPQRPSHPHVAGVAAMEDRGTLFVSDSRPQTDLPHPQSAGTTTPSARPARSRTLQLLAHLGLYLCCVCNHQQQQGQSQGQVQAQASSSQTQPATPSTFVTPTLSSRPNASTTRLTSFFHSQPHINEDIVSKELGQVQAQASSSQTQPEASSSHTQPPAPSTSVTPTSSSRPDALTIRQTSLFRSQPRTNEDIELQQLG